MITFVGVNQNFIVIFNPTYQHYKVYYKGNDIGITKYKYSDIQSYLN